MIDRAEGAGAGFISSAVATGRYISACLFALSPGRFGVVHR